MKSTYVAPFLLLFGAQAGSSDAILSSRSVNDARDNGGSLRVIFDEDKAGSVTADERIVVEDLIRQSATEVRELLPSLPDEIEVTVGVVDRDVDIVGGITGRADAPGEVRIDLSSVYPGGILAAARASLKSSVFHEFHHLYRGWTIRDNRYGPGIAVAAVNEGLADVFTETYTGIYFEAASGYPENADEWLAEIMLLPPDADYGTWMFAHPDGRTSIGYRVGRYIVHQAIRNSGKDVLALGEMSPDEILGLAQAATGQPATR